MAKNYQVVFQATIDPTSLQNELNRIGKQKLNLNAKGLTDFGNAAKSSGGMLQGFTSAFKNLGATAGKVVAFGSITAAIGMVTSALRDGIEEVVAYDKSIEELEKVVGAFSDEGLQNFSEQIGEIAESLSATMTDVVDATTTFVKTGASLQESMDLAEVAIQMQHTADETLEAATAAETLVAVTKAWDDIGYSADHIADAIKYWLH